MVRRHTEGWARDRLLQGLPVEERRLEVNGIATVVLEGGQGPPLLLLHGGIEWRGVLGAGDLPACRALPPGRP